MPTTVIYVQRIDQSDRTGPSGPFQDFLITGSEPDGQLVLPETWTFQVHTTNELMAAVCQRAQEIRRPVSILWREHRFGKQIVQVDILTESVVA